MKITAKNYASASKKVDFSKAPAPLKNTHSKMKTLLPHYDKSDRIREVVDLYLSKLNTWHGSATSKPKSTRKKTGGTTPKKTMKKTSSPAKKRTTKPRKGKSLEQLVLEATEVRDKLKSEVQRGRITKTTLKRAAAKVQATRDYVSKMVDNSAKHQRTLPLTQANLERWANNPGKFDLIGVDSPLEEPNYRPSRKYTTRSRRSFWSKFWHGVEPSKTRKK